MSGVRLSKQYGVNPSVLQCPICGKEFGLALFGSGLRDKKTGKEVEAPRKMAMPGQYCDDCKKIIDQGGTFIIEIKDEDEEKHSENPYRLGRIIAVKKEAVKEMFGVDGPMMYLGQTHFEHVFGEALKQQSQQQ